MQSMFMLVIFSNTTVWLFQHSRVNNNLVIELNIKENHSNTKQGENPRDDLHSFLPSKTTRGHERNTPRSLLVQSIYLIDIDIGDFIKIRHSWLI